MEYFTLKIGRLERKLPIIPLGKNVKIASFNLLGDRVLVEEIAKALFVKLKKIKFDYLVGPEVKVVPLLQELSRLLGKKLYVVCRKKVHGYMVSPIVLKEDFGLVMNGPDADIIKNKKTVILDDVVSSGVTMETVTKLISRAGGEVVAKVAVLKQEGKIKALEDVIFLEELPIFRT